MRSYSDMIVTRGSGTFERIDIKSTILGIVIPPLMMILTKLIVVAICACAIIFIGEIAGPALMIGVAYYALSRPFEQDKRHAWIAFGLGIFLIALEYVFQAWPKPIMWLFFFDKGLFVSWFGEPFMRADGTLVAARLGIGFIIPWMLWWPYQWSMWAWAAELLVPKMRETPFARLDPESAPQPPGVRLRPMTGRHQQDSDPLAHLPLGGQGAGPEIVGE